jgi:hypothetical protein
MFRMGFHVVQPIQPQPTPFTFVFGEATTTAGQRLSVVQIHTITGVQHLFAVPEEAEQIATQWASHCRQLRSGLILPALSPAARNAAADVLPNTVKAPGWPGTHTDRP